MTITQLIKSCPLEYYDQYLELFIDFAVGDQEDIPILKGTLPNSRPVEFAVVNHPITTCGYSLRETHQLQLMSCQGFQYFLTCLKEPDVTD